jgi:hypothetical protein
MAPKEFKRQKKRSNPFSPIQKPNKGNNLYPLSRFKKSTLQINFKYDPLFHVLAFNLS